jgi:c(7)-type cytochrome triheme protein
MKFRILTALVLLMGLPTLANALWTHRTVIFHNPAVGTVKFSHDFHLEALGKNCRLCHDAVFNIVPKKNPPITMAAMEKGKFCGHCHNGDMAFSVKENCAPCHPTHAIHFKVPDMGNVTFSHQIHTSMFNCKECHPKIFIAGKGNKFTMEDINKGKACGHCHNGKVAFSPQDDCSKCHQM